MRPSLRIVDNTVETAHTYFLSKIRHGFLEGEEKKKNRIFQGRTIHGEQSSLRMTYEANQRTDMNSTLAENAMLTSLWERFVEGPLGCTRM